MRRRSAMCHPSFRRLLPGTLLFAIGLCACDATAPEPAVSGEAKVRRPVAAKEERPGEDWPKFLGPRGTGVSGETGLAETWPEDGPPLIWEKNVGTGYSAPSIRGGRLVLHHRIADEEIVECLHPGTGKTLWNYGYESGFRDPYGYNNGPRCSPLLTEDRCYTYGAEGKLLCLDLKTGEKVWMRDVLKDFNLKKKDSDVPNWFFGIGCTPILEGDLLITLVGGQPDSAVVAFDAATGKTVWESVGKSTWDGVQTGSGDAYEWTGDEMLVSYSSPFAATIHGERHVLCLLRQGLVSLNPEDGSENFKYWFRSRSYESVNAARPLVIGDKIFLSAAYKTGSALLQVDADGQGVKELWRDRRNLLAHWSTPLHVDGYVYGFSGRHENEAEFRCIELDTGKVVWSTTGFDGDFTELERDVFSGEIRDRKTGEVIPFPFLGRGSKIRIGDRFIVLGERGTLALVRINPKQYDEIARTSFKQIHYPAWTAPVLSRKRLYLRCEDALICLDVAKQEPLPIPKKDDGG